MAQEVHIVGAGLSGTCLALSLLDAKFEGPIALYDKRVRFDDERHFCTWGPLPRYLRPYISHSWTDFQVLAPDDRARRRVSGLPYVHLEGIPFFLEAHRRLRRADNVRFVLGEAVEPESLVRGYVFDATDSPRGAPVLYQTTVSQRVRLDLPIAGKTVRLMDFRRDEGSTRYMTVLPFGPREALVQTTRIDGRGYVEPDDFEILSEYVAEAFPTRVRTVSSCERTSPILLSEPECGHEPMRTTLGMCGCAIPGTARYGLGRVVAQVGALTPSVVHGTRLPALRPPAAIRWVESKLIGRLAAGSSVAVESLSAMFRGSADAASRFLSGRPTWGDLAGALFSLPPHEVPMPVTRQRLAV